jgi:hypothetical protein
MPQMVITFPKVDRELEERLEAYIAEQGSRVNRTQVIRELLALGLEAVREGANS